MKKQQINFSWPASLSNFSKDSVQENFSRGKLKVFYKGETEDHRFFSDGFAEDLVKTLPYTPVVSYYDEEKEDFVGHATEQQIFGIVDPCVAPSFETDDKGVNWCICDVVLYTERPDKVGDLAEKIMGHSQSLELDPNSVKYVVNYDEKKHFKNIEFTAGKFVGVSVLGKDQKPAFSGSAFFSYNEQFEEKMQLLKNYCEKTGQSQHGGETMNLQEFIKLSWGEVSCKVGDVIQKEYERDAYTYVVDMYQDCAIMRFWYYATGDSKLMKINYSLDENNEVVLGDIIEVHVTYESIETPAPAPTMTETKDIEQVATSSATDAVSQAACDDQDSNQKNKEGEGNCASNEGEEEENTPKKEEKENCENAEEKTSKEKEDCNCNNKDENNESNTPKPEEENGDFSTATAQDSNVNDNQEPTTEKASVENENENKQENTSAATFTESERAELEALRREKKVTLVNSYKDNLSEEDYGKFMAMVDTADEEKLELELLRAYKASESSRENSKPMRVFAAYTPNTNADKNSFDSWVEKNLKRR